jgi:drug/metabolite transporter (DMT)-like permease
LAVESFSPEALTVIQSLVGALLLGTILLFRRSKVRIPWRLAIILGVLEPGLTFYFANLGFQRSTVSIGIMILSLETIFIVLIGLLWLKERVTSIEWIAVLIGISGAVIGANPWNGSTGASPLSVLFFSLAALMAALYVVTVRKYGANVDVYALAFGQMVASTIFCALVFLLTPGRYVAKSYELKFTGSAILAGLFGVGLAFLSFTIAAKKVRAAHLGIALNFILVIAMLGSWILGRGIPKLPQIIGALLVLFSLQALSWNQRRSNAAS